MIARKTSSNYTEELLEMLSSPAEPYYEDQRFESKFFNLNFNFNLEDNFGLSQDQNEEEITEEDHCVHPLKEIPSSSNSNANSDSTADFLSTASSITSPYDERRPSVDLLNQSKKIRKEKVKCNLAKGNNQSLACEEGKSSRRCWRPEEDAQLVELYAIHGPKWAKLASLMDNTRTRKQIRDRYLGFHTPCINNSEWTQEEEELFAALHKELGNKWVEIASHMPGRTEAQVKNKFYKPMKRKANANKSKQALGSPIMSISSLQSGFPFEKKDCVLSMVSSEDYLLEHAVSEDFWCLPEYLSVDMTFQDSFRDINIEAMFNI